MREKRNKEVKKNNGAFYVAVSLALIISFGIVAVHVYADVSLKQLIADALADKIAPEVLASLQFGDEPELGATPGTTVTIDELILGDSVSVALKLAAGNTTTPGAAGRLFNSGADKICGEVQVYFGGGNTNRIQFSVATSTASG